MVEECSSHQDKTDKQFSLNFAKISSILVDYSDFFAEKNEKPAALLVFSRMGPSIERLLCNKLKYWFAEYWCLEESKVMCRSSDMEISVQFFLKDYQYYLDSHSITTS